MLLLIYSTDIEQIRNWIFFCCYCCCYYYYNNCCVLRSSHLSSQGKEKNEKERNRSNYI